MKVKKKYYFIVILILLVLAFFIKNYIDDANNVAIITKNSISKINISKKEFLLALYEEKLRFETITGSDVIWQAKFDGILTEDVAKDNALNSLVLLKLSVNEATKRNIKLSSLDKKDSDSLYNDLIDKVSLDILNKIEINNNDLNKIIDENMLYFRLFNEITKNIVVNEEKFQKYLLDYIEKNKKDYENIIISYIFLKNYDLLDGEKIYFSDIKLKEFDEKIEEIKSKILNGEDFNSIIKKENSVFEVENNNYTNCNLENFPNIINEKAKTMSIGEYSDLIKTENGVYFIKLEDKITRDLSSIEILDIKDYYLISLKKEAFDYEFQKWKSDYQVKINQDLWNKISIYFFD